MEAKCPECGHRFDTEVVPGLKNACPRCMAELLRSRTGDANSNASAGVHEDDAPPLAVGARLRGYEVLEYLGRGGMGFVYKAKQAGLDRAVALKVLAPRLAGSPEFAARFGREAKALAALSHPNIVQIFDYGQESGLYFLVMEYVDGTSLRRILSTQRITPETALRYVPQICDALEYAHTAGVVHRDIKPENILIDKRGNLKIADFGLAKMAAAAGAPGSPVQDRPTVSGQAMGTPHYMAPEQVENMAAVDHRADIYSLGVVFYEMLTGELPLGRFPSPSQRVQVDVRFDEVVLKALEKEPQKRYQRASSLKEDVSRLTTIVADETRTNGATPSGKIRPKTSMALKLGLVFLAGSVISILVTAWGMLISLRTVNSNPNPSALADNLSFAILPGMVIGPLFIAAVVCFIVAFVKRSKKAGSAEPVATDGASAGNARGKPWIKIADGNMTEATDQPKAPNRARSRIGFYVALGVLMALGLFGAWFWTTWKAKQISRLETDLFRAGDRFGAEQLQPLFDDGSPEAFTVIQRFASASPKRLWLPQDRIFLVDRPVQYLCLDQGVSSSPESSALVSFSPSDLKLPAARNFGVTHEPGSPLSQRVFFHAGLKVISLVQSNDGLMITFDFDDAWKRHVEISGGDPPYAMDVSAKEVSDLFPAHETGIMREDEIAFNPDVAIKTMQYWFKKSGITVRPKARDLSPLQAANISWGQPVNMLQAGLAVGQARFEAGKPLDITLHIRNTGEKDVNIAAVGRLVQEDAEAGIRNVPMPGGSYGWEFMLIGNEPSVGRLAHPEPAKAQALTVRKGETGKLVLNLGGREELKGMFGGEEKLPSSSKFRFALHYSHEPHEGSADCPYWHGKITTGEVEIEIVEPDR